MSGFTMNNGRNKKAGYPHLIFV